MADLWDGEPVPDKGRLGLTASKSDLLADFDVNVVSVRKWEPTLGGDVDQSGSGSLRSVVEQAVRGAGRPDDDGGTAAAAPARSATRWRRRALSVTQDLRALAGLVHDAAYRRRYNQAMSTLDQLGKRQAPAVDDDPQQDLDDLWLLPLRRRRW